MEPNILAIAVYRKGVRHLARRYLPSDRNGNRAIVPVPIFEVEADIDGPVALRRLENAAKEEARRRGIRHVVGLY